MFFFIHVNIKQLVPAAHPGYQRSSGLPNVSNAPDSQESPLQCCNQALAGNWWAQSSQVVINTQQAQRSLPGNSVFARSTARANMHSFPPLQPHCSSAAFQRTPWENSNPFLLMLINNHIKKCAGCSFAFKDPRGPPLLVSSSNTRKKAHTSKMACTKFLQNRTVFSAYSQGILPSCPH